MTAIDPDELRSAQKRTGEVREGLGIQARGGAASRSPADLVAREFKPPKWAVPDLVPEGLSILAGKPKTGKSWLALDFVVAVADFALQGAGCQLLAISGNWRHPNHARAAAP